MSFLGIVGARETIESSESVRVLIAICGPLFDVLSLFELVIVR